MSKHNHITRDIKPLGQCPGCDEYHDRHIPKAPEPKVYTSSDITMKDIKVVTDHDYKESMHFYMDELAKAKAKITTLEEQVKELNENLEKNVVVMKRQNEFLNQLQKDNTLLEAKLKDASELVKYNWGTTLDEAFSRWKEKCDGADVVVKTYKASITAEGK